MSLFWMKIKNFLQECKELKKSEKQLRDLIKLSRLLQKHNRYHDALKAMKIAVELLEYMRNQQLKSEKAKKECEWRLQSLLEECQYIASEQENTRKILKNIQVRKKKKLDKIYFQCRPAVPGKQATESQLLQKNMLEAAFSEEETVAKQACELIQAITAMNICDKNHLLQTVQHLQKNYEEVSQNYNDLKKSQLESSKIKVVHTQKEETKDCKPSDEEKEVEEITKSLMNSLNAHKSTFKFSDVIGIDAAKEGLDIAIRQQNIFIKSYETKDLEKCKGILLFGPPGTGKSMLAKAAANEGGAKNFFYLSKPDLVTKWVGSSEKRIKQLFKLAAEMKPSVIFLDEADSLFGKRSSEGNDSSTGIINALLTEIQDKPDDVFLLASTNRPWAIDPAFRRRFNRLIYVPLPGLRDRAKILRYHLEEVDNMLTAKDYRFLAEVTHLFSPCDITNLIQAAKIERWSRIKRAKYFKTCPRILSKPEREGKYLACKKGDGGSRMDPFAIADKVLHPPLTMKDLERGMWVAKNTGDPKDLPKLKEFANTVGQTIHSDDEADYEDDSETESELDSETESELDSESEEDEIHGKLEEEEEESIEEYHPTINVHAAKDDIKKEEVSLSESFKNTTISKNKYTLSAMCD